jgi:hypothetical protein
MATKKPAPAARKLPERPPLTVEGQVTLTFRITAPGDADIDQESKLLKILNDILPEEIRVWVDGPEVKPWTVGLEYDHKDVTFSGDDGDDE